MSDLLSAMAGELGPQALAQIGASLGASLGASPQQTQSAVAAALPALVQGLARNASQPQGAQALATALERNHTPNLMDSLGPLAGMLLAGQGGGNAGGAGGLLGGLLGAALGGGAPQPAAPAGLGGLLGALVQGGLGAQPVPPALNGAGILGHILGNQQGTVVQSVSKASGMSPDAVSRLLPVLAPIVMSALGTLKAQRSLDAGGVANLVQTEHQRMAPQAAPAQGLDLGAIGGALLQSGLLNQLFR